MWEVRRATRLAPTGAARCLTTYRGACLSTRCSSCHRRLDSRLDHDARLLVAALVFAVGRSVRAYRERAHGWPSIVALGVAARARLSGQGRVLPRRNRRARDARVRAVGATMGFAQAVAGDCGLSRVVAPQIAYVSRLKGSPTFGDVGRLNYLWFVANVPGPVSSAFALPARFRRPPRPGRRSCRWTASRDPHPAVYDIDAPIPGTLPDLVRRGPLVPRRDGAVASDGVSSAPSLGTRACTSSCSASCSSVRVAAPRRPDRSRVVTSRPCGRRPVLVVPALAALAMYALVLVQSRYVAPFALLLFAGLVPPWATDDLSRRIRAGLAAGAVVAIPTRRAPDARRRDLLARRSAAPRATSSRALAARGVGPGARLGFVGEAYDALWARTARMRFVSVVPSAEADRFWALDAAGRAARPRAHAASTAPTPSSPNRQRWG